MGRDRYRILDPAAPHFLTCTVLEWLPLFAQPANARILLGSLRLIWSRSSSFATRVLGGLAPEAAGVVKLVLSGPGVCESYPARAH